MHVDRNPAVEHDTEDKAYWCRKGEIIEEAFIREIVPRISRSLIIHPNKKLKNTYIDFLDIDKNSVADLKAQNTPFFKATMYGYNPQYTVTFNRKDYENYKKNYPEAMIYWWVNWEQTQITIRNILHSVEPLYGVWEVPFSKIKIMIESNRAPLHIYKFRQGDQVNATESYLFELNSFTRLL